VLSSWPTWRGFVRAFPAEIVRARRGEIDLRFGASSLRYGAGAFALSVMDRQLRLSAVLVPRVWATMSHLGLGDRGALEWVVVPHLEATGWAEVDGVRARLDRAAAYHDHNWGEFSWGSGLAWEWGFVLPPDGAARWALVFSRILDGASARTSSQGLLVWQGADHVRTFSDGELEITRAGTHREERLLTLPPACALLAPGAASGVPAELTLHAAGLGDALEVSFTTERFARLAIPSEDDPFGCVLLNEAEGRATVSGEIDGARVAFQAPAVVEFVRGS
jgi:hypothetical protein